MYPYTLEGVGGKVYPYTPEEVGGKVYPYTLEGGANVYPLYSRGGS